MEINFSQFTHEQRRDFFQDMKDLGTLTIGEFIEQLRIFPTSCKIISDFSTYPRSVNSWRGDYSQMSLSWDGEYKEPLPTVGDILKICDDALYTDFEGYKGGTYTCSPKKSLWFDNWGECDHIGIICLTRDDDEVIIHTSRMSW